MRKTVVLGLIFLLLAAAVWAAEPPEMNGQLIFAMTAGEDTINHWYSQAWVGLAEQVSERASIHLELEAAYKTGGAGTAKPWSLYLEDFYGQVALLPGVELLFGWYGPAVSTYTISNYGYENVAAFEPGSAATAALKARWGRLGLLSWFNPSGLEAYDAQTNPARLGANLTLDLKPISLSGWYYAANLAELDRPKVGASMGAAFGIVALDVEAAQTAGEPAAYGAALRVGGPAFGLGANAAGVFDGGLSKVGFELDGELSPHLGVMSGIAFNTADGMSFDNLELGGWVKVDVVKVRFGYIFTDTGAAMGSMYASAVPPKGGAWVKAYLNF